MNIMFQGSIVALVTPFGNDGQLDFTTAARLAEWHLRSGTDGILVAGCTGESFTLSDSDRIELFRAVKGVTRDRIKILVGTGASATKTAIARTKAALEAGADGALVITPFGNKPSQHALEMYFSEVADVGLPVVLYNVPGRTGTTLAPETAIRLSRHQNIVAIKEASGSLDAVSTILRDSDMFVLSGDDSLTIPMISLGAKGVISTTANLLPREFSEMVHAALDGDFKKAAELHLRMFPVMKALFIEGNPVPLKAAMHYSGLLPNTATRPPLKGMSENNKAILMKTLEEYGNVR